MRSSELVVTLMAALVAATLGAREYVSLVPPLAGPLLPVTGAVAPPREVSMR